MCCLIVPRWSLLVACEMVLKVYRSLFTVCCLLVDCCLLFAKCCCLLFVHATSWRLVINPCVVWCGLRVVRVAVWWLLFVVCMCRIVV